MSYQFGTLVLLSVFLLAGSALWVSTLSVGPFSQQLDVAEEDSPSPSASPSASLPSLYPSSLLQTLLDAEAHVALIAPRSALSDDDFSAFASWKERQYLLNDSTVQSHWYMSSQKKDHRPPSTAKDVTQLDCGGRGLPEVEAINCLAMKAVADGATHVCLIDEAEFWDGAEADEAGRHWVTQAVMELQHEQLEGRFYVAPVRHMGVAGRGAQWRSRVTLDLPDIWPHFEEEVLRREAEGERREDQEYWQYKFLNQYSGSVCVHRQHVEVMGEMLHVEGEESVLESISSTAALYSYSTYTDDLMWLWRAV